MDEQLRANPQDVATLMRAGRLSPRRVALAAYLGDAKALAVGIEVWRFLQPSHDHWWPARYLLERGPLSHQEIVWAASLVAERAARHWGGGDEPAVAIELSRAWCMGEATGEVVLRGAELAFEASEAETVDALTGTIYCGTDHSAHSACRVAFAASAPEDEAGEQAGRALVSADDLAASHTWVEGRYEDDPDAADAARAAERAWQAQAIADILLDPDWPPWEE